MLGIIALVVSPAIVASARLTAGSSRRQGEREYPPATSARTRPIHCTAAMRSCSTIAASRIAPAGYSGGEDRTRSIGPPDGAR